MPLLSPARGGYASSPVVANAFRNVGAGTPSRPADRWFRGASAGRARRL